MNPQEAAKKAAARAAPVEEPGQEPPCFPEAQVSRLGPFRVGLSFLGVPTAAVLKITPCRRCANVAAFCLSG